MASVTMTDEDCGARCGRKLSKGNTNPHRLCGHCQGIITGARLQRWITSGRQTFSHFMSGEPKPKTLVRPTKAERKLADPSELPTAYLIECNKELRFRASKLAREAKLLTPFMEK